MSDFNGYCVAEVGTNGVGKTYLGLGLCLELYRKKEVDRVFIVVVDDEEEDLQHYKNWPETKIRALKKGVVKIITRNPDQTFERFFNDVPPHSAIFIDDAGAMMKSKEPEIENVLARRRQKKLHLVMNFHSAQSCPRRFFKNLEEFWIFLTTDSIKHLADRLRDPRLFEMAVELIDKAAQRHGMKGVFYRFRLKAMPDRETLAKALRSRNFEETPGLFIPQKK